MVYRALALVVGCRSGGPSLYWERLETGIDTKVGVVVPNPPSGETDMGSHGTLGPHHPLDNQSTVWVPVIQSRSSVDLDLTQRQPAKTHSKLSGGSSSLAPSIKSNGKSNEALQPLVRCPIRTPIPARHLVHLTQHPVTLATHDLPLPWPLCGTYTIKLLHGRLLLMIGVIDGIRLSPLQTVRQSVEAVPDLSIRPSSPLPTRDRSEAVHLWVADSIWVSTFRRQRRNMVVSCSKPVELWN